MQAHARQLNQNENENENENVGMRIGELDIRHGLMLQSPNDNNNNNHNNNNNSNNMNQLNDELIPKSEVEEPHLAVADNTGIDII